MAGWSHRLRPPPHPPPPTPHVISQISDRGGPGDPAFESFVGIGFGLNIQGGFYWMALCQVECQNIAIFQAMEDLGTVIRNTPGPNSGGVPHAFRHRLQYTGIYKYMVKAELLCQVRL